MLTIEQKEIVNKVITHPAFQFSDSKGNNFYNEKRLETLYSAIELMLLKIDTTYQELPIPKRVEKILSAGLPEFPCNFNSYYSSGLEETDTLPDERLEGRTAYGLLCTDLGSNCIGFSEASCILLNLEGYEATPIISKLLKSNQASCHYVTGVKDGDMVEIIDAERLRSCSEPEKSWDLTAYQANMMFTTPDLDFANEKLVRAGLGPKFLEFTQREGKSASKPMDYIKENYPNILDENGRLSLKSSDMTQEVKAILDEAINESVSIIYEQSLELGNLEQNLVRKSA